MCVCVPLCVPVHVCQRGVEMRGLFKFLMWFLLEEGENLGAFLLGVINLVQVMVVMAYI